MLQSEQKYTHFCSDWSIMGYGIGALWDLWNWWIRKKNPILAGGCMYKRHVTAAWINNYISQTSVGCNCKSMPKYARCIQVVTYDMTMYSVCWIQNFAMAWKEPFWYESSHLDISITMTSHDITLALRHLIPLTIWLFVQNLIQAYSKETIRAIMYYWPFVLGICW